MKLKKILFFSIAATIFVPLAHLQTSQAKASEKSAMDRQVLGALLPTMEEISGWEFSSTPQFFEPGNLWEYIDGAAELYLQYGFRMVVTSEYTSRKDSNFLNVEIYQMESPDHAFGIYAAERSPDDNFVQIGVQGYLGESYLNFWKGPYYVKLISFQTSSGTKGVLLEFSRLIADKIAGNYSEPELFACFPETNKVKMSERYIPNNFLGHPFLKNGYRVDYVREESQYQLFLVDNGSPEKAEEVFNKYQNFFKSQNEKISHEKGIDYQKICTKDGKVIFQYESIIGGVLNIDDLSEAEGIIEEMLKKLRHRNQTSK